MSAPPTGTGLRVEGLTIEYTSAGSPVRPIDGLDLHAPPGSLVLLLGPSGCGKTSLLSCIAGILRPSAGSVAIGDVQVGALAGGALADYRRHGVGIVFQAFNLVASLTAAENVMVPLRAAGHRARAARRRALELLDEVELGDRADHRPGQLSGGQQQRVAIARALALDPPLVVADEPTAHLDHANLESVLRLLRRLTADGRTVVVSTHDDRLLPLADQIVELAPRRVTSGFVPGPVDLADGEVLFRAGDPSDWVYTVLTGAVDIVAPGDGSPVVVRTVVAGEWFGEMGPLFGLPRSAAAIARGPATVEPCTVGAFRERLGVASLAALIAQRPMVATAGGGGEPPAQQAGS